jgi:preprotein translocase subunit SecF
VDFWRRQTWDLVGRSWIWFTLSGVLFVLGVAAWIGMGLNLGIDFTGGSLLQYKFAGQIAEGSAAEGEAVGKIRSALDAVGLSKVEIQIASGAETTGAKHQIVMVRTSANTDQEQAAEDAKISEALDTLFGAQVGKVETAGREMVGPIVGADLRNKAIMALLIGSFLILIYITIRYEFRFAVAAVIALLHDAFILTGAMALLRIELNSWFVAAVLTVLGFSMHDTVIIMDRIRENRRLHRFTPFHDIVNASLLQTMARSINTVFTVLLTMFALAIFGGETLRGFSISLIIGITLGAYSSIFNASQLVVVWDRYSRSRKKVEEPRTRRSATTVASTRPVSRRSSEEVMSAAANEQAEGDEGEKVGALEAIRRAEAQAQDEKREERRERRKTKKGGKGSGKRRF